MGRSVRANCREIIFGQKIFGGGRDAASRARDTLDTISLSPFEFIRPHFHQATGPHPRLLSPSAPIPTRCPSPLPALSIHTRNALTTAPKASFDGFRGLLSNLA